MKYKGRRVSFGEKIWIADLGVGGRYEDIGRTHIPLKWEKVIYIGMCQYGTKFKRYWKSKAQKQNPVVAAFQPLDSHDKKFLIGFMVIPDKEVQNGEEILPSEIPDPCHIFFEEVNDV